MNHEIQRLTWYLTERGIEEALDFARRTFRIYWAARAAAKRRVNFYGRAYKRELVESLIIFRHFLRTGSLEM